MRTILSILVINTLLIGPIGWAEEPQTPAPAGESTSPPSSEQPTSEPTEAAPTPAPAPTAPAAPAPSGTPPTEAATEKSTQQTPEHAQEEKEKKATESASPPSSEQPTSEPTEAAPTPAPALTPPSGAPSTEAAPTPAPAPTPPSGAPSTEAAPTPAPAPTPPSGTPPTEATTEKSAQQTLEQTQEEKEQKKIETTLTETSLIKGRLQLEVIETYVHTSSNQLFIEGLGLLPILILGPIEVQKIRRDSFNTTFVARYKISKKVQASLNIPYVFSFTRISSATGTSAGGVVNPSTETTSSNYGLGDVNGAITYQALNEGLVRPTVSVALSFKGRTGQDVFESDSPTGSGFNSVGFAISASKTSDPAVFFGSLSYAYAIPRNNVVFKQPNQPARYIDFEPGANIGISFGVAYALNYKITLNMQYQESINLTSQVNHKNLSNSFTNSASLRFGGTWRINDKTSIDLSVSPGLTEDSADTIVSLRIPWRF
jgi:hypothetical protein